MQQGQGCPWSKPSDRSRSSSYEPPISSRFQKSGYPFSGHRPSRSRSRSPRSGSRDPVFNASDLPSHLPPKSSKRNRSGEVSGVDFSRFWKIQKGKDRNNLRPEHERFLDTSRFDSIPAKFDPSNHGQAKHKYYCNNCDVSTRTLSQMQAHETGAKHKRMCAQVHRFRCDLCFVDVPCRDTLDNHMRGKNHIKRVMQLEEERQKKGEVVAGEGCGGYRVGPREMAKLVPTEKEELESLRKTVRTLRVIVQEQNQKLAKSRAIVR